MDDNPLIRKTDTSASIVLGFLGSQSRATAHQWIEWSPEGWVMTLAEEPPIPKAKNLFFVICTALEKSDVLWDGDRQSKTDWYDLLLSAYAVTKGWKPYFVVGLEGERLRLGRWSIRNLTKSQVSELIDYAKEWAASKGVVVADDGGR